MYYVLYDKDFNALGVKKTYHCNSWSYIQRAIEFNELSMEGVAIENDDGAMYVGLHNEYALLDNINSYAGMLKALAFCGIPETLNGKTKIKAVDIRQILNNDTVIDLTKISSVKELYTELLSCLFKNNNNLGITTNEPDTYEIEETEFDNEMIERIKAPGNVWEYLNTANAIYDCYIDTDVDFINKRITFKVKKIGKFKNIKLADFTNVKLRRDTTSINRVVCYKDGDYTIGGKYYLLSNDKVVEERNLSIDDNQTKILYPANIEIVEDEELSTAKTKGIQKLLSNRFNAKVEIPLDNKMGQQLSEVDLSYLIDIYEYKPLPVMELSEDSKGKKKIKLGRIEENWI